MKNWKKRGAALALTACLGLTLCPSALAAEDSERGVLDYSIAISPQYEDAQLFSDGLAAVKKDGKWGYINEDGETVIPFEYDVVGSFSEGLALVGQLCYTQSYDDWEYNPETDSYDIVGSTEQCVYELGFIDRDNNLTWFHDPYSEDILEYMEFDTPPVRRCETSLLYSMEAGTTLDDQNKFFYNGYVCLAGFDGPGYYLYNTDGQQETFGQDYIGFYNWQLTEGIIITGDPVFEGGGQSYFNTVTGECIEVPFDYENYHYAELFPFNQGLAPVILVDYDYNGKLGFIDTTGHWVIQPQYDLFWRTGVYGKHEVFGDTGLAMVSKGEIYGGIDKTGKAVIPFQYEDLMPYNFGLAAFKQNGLYGYLDGKGNVAIEPKFERVTGFGDDGYAVAFNGESAYLIDSKGNAIPGADNLNPDSYMTTDANGNVMLFQPDEFVVVEENGLYGYGKVSYKPALPEITEMNGWAFAEVVAAIEADLVPTHLQNLYLNNINRNEFCELVIQAISEVLDQDIKDIVATKTGKTLSAWQQGYPFTDANSSDVIAAYALGIVTGRGNGLFDPYATITRQEASAFLMRAAKVLGMNTDSVQAADFADSAQVGVWFKDSVNFVYQINVMGGTGNNNFTPLGTYTREQSYMTIYRLFQAIVRA